MHDEGFSSVVSVKNRPLIKKYFNQYALIVFRRLCDFVADAAYCLGFEMMLLFCQQAYIVGGDNATGLIPSVELEERRRAFVPKENVYTRQTGETRNQIQTC